MSHSQRLDSFVREFPFPWSVDPRDPSDVGRGYGRCENDVRRSLMDFEVFLEQFRQQMVIRDGQETSMSRPPQPHT